MDSTVQLHQGWSGRYRRERGSVYLAVLGASMIVMIVGVGAVLAVRGQSRAVGLDSDVAAARRHAISAIEVGWHWMNQNPLWRWERGSGVWLSQVAIGDGDMTLEVIDPVDGEITSSRRHRVRLIATGRQGRAVHRMQVDFEPMLQPVGALVSAVHAGDELRLNSSSILTVTGGPAWANGNLRRDGSIIGDFRGSTQSGSGSRDGVLIVPGEVQSLPDADVIEHYIARATPIQLGGGAIDRMLLTPGHNPWGATNPDGVYYIEHNNDLIIRRSRIHGTLIVRLPPGRKLRIENTVLIHNHRADYPTLIVEGDVELRYDSEAHLSESSESRNFNPPGSPFEGASNLNQVDELPSEIRGLVHVLGSVEARETHHLRGMVVCHGEFRLSGSRVTVARDRDYAAQPPVDYEKIVGMRPIAGSWQRVVD